MNEDEKISGYAIVLHRQMARTLQALLEKDMVRFERCVDALDIMISPYKSERGDMFE